MAQDSSNYYGKLDEQTLIFKHLDRLSHLSTEIESISDSNIKSYAHRFQMGVGYLRSLLNPLIDEKFKEEEKNMKTKRKNIPRENHEERIRANNDLLEKLIKLLYRNNVYWGEREDIVIDETKEGEEDEEEAYTLD